MSEAVSGLGAAFKRWEGEGTWSAIAEITNMDGPGMSKDAIETTSMDNSDGYRTYLGGLKDPGDFSFSMIFYRTTYETIKTDFERDALHNYAIELPDDANTFIEFEGIIKELGLAIPMDDKIMCEVTIKISGKPEMDSGTVDPAEGESDQ